MQCEDCGTTLNAQELAQVDEQLSDAPVRCRWCGPCPPDCGSCDAVGVYTWDKWIGDALRYASG